jgi:hypothetical protein
MHFWIFSPLLYRLSYPAKRQSAITCRCICIVVRAKTSRKFLANASAEFVVVRKATGVLDIIGFVGCLIIKVI